MLCKAIPKGLRAILAQVIFNRITMCTLSILPFKDGEYSLFMNRDESPLRAPATELRRRGGALFPVDPVSDGTWIAANRHGVGMALMNQHPEAWRRPKNLISRGLIIPSLLKARNVDEAAELACGLDPSHHAPFLLVLCGREGSIKHLRWDGEELHFWGRPRAPYFSCSSAVLYEQARAQRRQLFERLLAEHRPTRLESAAKLQSIFHRSHEPSKGMFSVCMHREDAASISLTELRVGKAGLKMKYQEGPPCERGKVREGEL